MIERAYAEAKIATLRAKLATAGQEERRYYATCLAGWQAYVAGGSPFLDMTPETIEPLTTPQSQVRDAQSRTAAAKEEETNHARQGQLRHYQDAPRPEQPVHDGQ